MDVSPDEMQNNNLRSKISVADSVSGVRPDWVGLWSTRGKSFLSSPSTFAFLSLAFSFLPFSAEELTVHFCVLPLLYAKQKGGCHICIQSERPLHPPFALATLWAVYIKKKAQVEAGVSQLNIYTVLAFVLPRTYLTFMNGGRLTPFNSHSKQVLLAPSMCQD